MTYKQVETAESIEVYRKGNFVKPIATLTDGYGLCNIIEDDHCYVVCLKKDGIFQPSPYLFSGAHECLSKLPILDAVFSIGASTQVAIEDFA
jgi:hypothetical protein